MRLTDTAGRCWCGLVLATLLATGPVHGQETPGNPAAAEPPSVPESLAQPASAEAPEAEATATTGKPASTVPPAPTPLWLNRLLGLEDHPVRVFGWIENSFTGNTNGRPASGTNFGVYPNHLADQWMGNQYYFVVEKPLLQNDEVNWGFRFDTLVGNDWQFTKDYGLFDRAYNPNSFGGVDLPQLYGEIHLPILTQGGVDLRAGRFYSLTGYENPQAIARPLLSVPYSMNYTPFTFLGAIASVHVNSRLSAFGGSVNGFDRWFDESYKMGFMGGLTWTSRDECTTFVFGGASVPDQLPRFPSANSPYLPVGVSSLPILSGLRNVNYGGSYRNYVVAVLTHKWTEKLTQALETDQVWDPDVMGFGANPSVPQLAAYHGFVNWFLYAVTDKVTGVWRSELFADPYGLATGVADTYAEMTLGLNIRPQPWLWVRPEARYDWAQFGHPYNDGTREGQFTLGFDVIVLF